LKNFVPAKNIAAGIAKDSAAPRRRNNQRREQRKFCGKRQLFVGASSDKPCGKRADKLSHAQFTSAHSNNASTQVFSLLGQHIFRQMEDS
jgi:hypothetical protein